MGLVLTSLEDEIFMKNNVRFRVIGDLKRLPVEVQEKLRETEEHTRDNTAMTMVVALSYSSRWEITEAVKDIAKEWEDTGKPIEDINEDTVDGILRDEVGRIFTCVLENAGVFKRDAEGRAAFQRFAASL